MQMNGYKQKDEDEYFNYYNYLETFHYVEMLNFNIQG
jgi:hypothetical protein